LCVLILECSVRGGFPLQCGQCSEPRVRLAEDSQTEATDDDENDHHHGEGCEQLGADADGYPRHEARQRVDGPTWRVSSSSTPSVRGATTGRLAYHFTTRSSDGSKSCRSLPGPTVRTDRRPCIVAAIGRERRERRLGCQSVGYRTSRSRSACPYALTVSTIRVCAASWPFRYRSQNAIVIPGTTLLAGSDVSSNGPLCVLPCSVTNHFGVAKSRYVPLLIGYHVVSASLCTMSVGTWRQVAFPSLKGKDSALMST